MNSGSECASNESIGSLVLCLVEGDLDQSRRERGLKRRALVCSVLFQTFAAGALILFPLLGKTERILLPDRYTIVPPYAATAGSHRDTSHARSIRAPKRPCYTCFRPGDLRPVAQVRNGKPEIPEAEALGNNTEPGFVEHPGIPGGLSETTREPERPRESPDSAPARRRVSEGVQAAQLVHRIEPIYPPLAIQTHRDGRVELRAIISVDGTIESLEVLSGDPLFLQSALAAVREWRYRPTILNGKPVEIDTHITVIYSMNR